MANFIISRLEAMADGVVVVVDDDATFALVVDSVLQVSTVIPSFSDEVMSSSSCTDRELAVLERETRVATSLAG